MNYLLLYNVPDIADGFYQQRTTQAGVYTYRQSIADERGVHYCYFAIIFRVCFPHIFMERLGKRPLFSD